jgi:tetratricopeptide (TPR) repeat protein
MPKVSNLTLSLAFGAAAVALLLASPSGLRAETENAQETPQLSDATGDGLAKLKPLLDVKDWAGAVKLLDELLQAAPAESYDQAFLLDTKAKIFAQSNDYPAAVEPMETALAISDRHHFFTNRQEMDDLYFLSQLYYEDAESGKKPKDEQVASYEKSIGAIRHWLRIAPKVTEDISDYYSRLLYAEAVAKDGNHPDQDLIRQAREQVEKTLLLAVHPKDGTYQLLLATMQQQQDFAASAELLEMLLAKTPAKKDYWQELLNFYIYLAQNTKDAAKNRSYTIRAINTLERAQALGFLKTPRENYVLFTFYYEMAQYGTAADLLYKGLSSGSIESDLDKWSLLAASYQQINQDFTAIEVLKDAAKRYPTNGDLDLKIANIYAGLEKPQEAFDFYQTAEQKGVKGKSQKQYLLLALAYQAYELQKFDEAKDAVNKALELNPGDHQLKVLKNAIDEAIKDRDTKKAEADARDAAMKAVQ